MRTHVVWLFLAIATIAMSVSAGADESRTLDLRASKATFSIKHILVANVTGTVPIVSAAIHFESDNLTPTSIDVTLDPKRIATGESERDADLQSADWFDTKRFPTWTFRSAKITRKSPDTFDIEGILTAHGVGVAVVLDVKRTRDGPSPQFTATTHVDRRDFGMAVTRTGLLVGNDITITIEAKTKPG